ncbi:hypothetical protein BN874_70002 [Candidatus Contendobacter odensis Run_B_J11]|uniref:Uncharacterized protein n=1 Tax=Candidatus Contendobacter odensis Run_B_J11 TaxID=1400861 RepID=A0A7U7J5X5_9GAMM|nr:hypothetical protein BN874_70002 [Candidatus Contendobacter odensis Run_B_J11]
MKKHTNNLFISIMIKPNCDLHLTALRASGEAGVGPLNLMRNRATSLISLFVMSRPVSSAQKETLHGC